MDRFDIYCRRASDHIQRAEYAEAEAILLHLSRDYPPHAGVQRLLARIAEKRGDLALAADRYRSAASMLPDDPLLNHALGAVLLQLGRHGEALQPLRAALRADPGSAGIRNNLAAACIGLGLMGEAEEHCRASLAAEPNCFAATNLGRVLADTGRHAEAIACCRDALRLNPGYAPAYENLLLSMCYCDETGDGAVLEEHRHWARSFAEPLTAAATRPPRASLCGRPLRVGYVSPDFRTHSVASFIEPALRHHDRTRVEVHCYSDVNDEDEVTRRLQGLAAYWHPVSGQSDEALAGLIRSHGIDVLVDLAGHTAGNRLLVFARRPAATQVTWMGYPNTTGMSAMDFRIVDAITDPPGSPPQYSEQRALLGGCFLCYQPPSDLPQVASLPALDTGHVTFGSFNNTAKVTAATLDRWAAALQAAAGSRLIVKSRQMADAGARALIAEGLSRRGIDQQRIQFLAAVSSSREHLSLYNRIDIALDTYPYAGTTTTCEALIMGVPVITCTGRTHASRVGASLLTAAGRSDLVTDGVVSFARCAARLAAETQRLAALRQTLRDSVMGSPLCDGPAFAQQFEALLLSLAQT